MEEGAIPNREDCREPTFLGKSQVPVSKRENYVIEESEETGSLFTEELVLQRGKPIAVEEQTHAQGKDTCPERQAYSMGVKHAWASRGKKVPGASGKRESKAKRCSC